ncbi:MAG: PQQ-dependent sugar dehydrogenase [bacterium]|nr:PQQ-dependent sugar dehydrogenase [bacterium]
MRYFFRPKIFIPLFILILTLGVAIFLFLLKTKVGDLRPALFPPSKDLVSEIEKQKIGENVSIPLKFDTSFKIGVFAKKLGPVRDLQFSPGGTLLASVPAQGRVVALPDVDNDGKADKVVNLLTGLNKPHGLAFYQGKLFVAELTKVSRYSFDEKKLTTSFDKKLFSYPYQGGHSTRSVVIDKNGVLFVTVGSSCNVCVESEEWLAGVVVSDTEGRKPRLFAKGLRNSVFLKISPETGKLWGTDMGRDLLGDNTPKEDINIIKDGGDYGWPFCYENKVHDDKFDPGNNHSCESTSAPVWSMQAHSAPLGLNFIDSQQFPDSWQGDMLVAFHGSWNRTVPTGYKIVKLDVKGSSVISQEDFITGFLAGSSALGRPVDLEFDSKGSLFISDDKIGAIYKLVKK